MKTRCCSIAMLLVSAWLVQAQGTFRNMDFSLMSPLLQPGLVPASSAMPFWTVYLGSTQYPDVLYNSLSLDVEVGIIDNNYQFGASIPWYNTALLIAGMYPPTGIVSAAIAQTGQLPPDARSLVFLAHGFDWNVTIGGLVIPVAQLSQASNGYSEFAADISPFAGQTEELRFTALTGNGLGQLFLGDIQFSSVAVPEASVASLFVLGGLAFGLRVHLGRK